jgi:hypothetical protein
MADLHNEFIVFHDRIALTSGRKAVLRTARDAIRERIRNCFFETLKIDEVVKSQKFAFHVIPAKAGIYSFRMVMDSGFRRNDDMKTFYDTIKN